MATNSAVPCIEVGDYIVIQRQKYTKLQKFGSIDTLAMLGNEQLELRGLLHQRYGATFKMCLKEVSSESGGSGSKKGGGKRGNGGGRSGGQRLHTLELCSEQEMRNIRDVLGITESGEDNRNIQDESDSQALRPEDIEQLREECNASTQILEKIVENSKTFHTKTEYSQEKYLRKKEKKYFEYVQIQRPTVRLLAEIFYRQDADKIMGLRIDTLSQVVSYSGVCAFGSFLMYESGTNGLLPATFLNAIGARTEGRLVHMHPGNVPQRQGLLALNLPEEQLQRCVSVNVYSVLRQFYQGEAVIGEPSAVEVSSEAEVNEPISKKVKLHEGNGTHSEGAGEPTETSELAAIEEAAESPDEKAPTADATSPLARTTNQQAVAPLKWQLENRRAVEMMTSKFDSLVIAAKENPADILKALLPFVKPSRPIVIFSMCKEILMELYVDLKAGANVTNLHMYSNWWRLYQILPNRTHPEVNMNGNSGYFLTGYTVTS